MAIKWVEVKYSGRVQGVGFRFTAERLARQRGLAGYVRNLYDGGVEVVAEGEEESLKVFLSDLDSEMGRYIDDRIIEWDEPKGDFSIFEIKSD